MIDIHCHVLPDIDDGAPGMPDSVAMCRVASFDGIRTIAATPHALDGVHHAPPTAVRRLVAALSEILLKKNIPVTVVPGMEIRVVPDLNRRLEEGSVITLNNGRYLLIEFHSLHVPMAFMEIAETIVRAGYGFVLSHPERNLAIRKYREQFIQLLSKFERWDFLVQLSAESLTGKAGPEAQKAARYLLTQNAAHVIASDGHSPFDRPPILSAAVKVAAGIVGKDRALQMVTEVPGAVLFGTPFPSSWEPARPRKWWSSLFGS